MTETADELSTPLGQETARKKRRFRLPFTAMQVLAVLLGLFLVGFATIALFTDNPFGGEPVAHIALHKTPGADDKAAPAASGPAEPAAKSATNQGGEHSRGALSRNLRHKPDNRPIFQHEPVSAIHPGALFGVY
jgi:hypothetical protein